MAVPPDVRSASGAEKRKPDDSQDQNGETCGDRKQREHGRARLGLSRLGRRFNNLTLSLGCHHSPISLQGKPLPAAVHDGNARFTIVFRGLRSATVSANGRRAQFDDGPALAVTEQPAAVNAVVRFPTWFG